MVSGDSVTHAGRAAAQQEAEDAGLASSTVNEALGYGTKDKSQAQKASYTPQIPLAFMLQRAGFSFTADSEYALGHDASKSRDRG